MAATIKINLVDNSKEWADALRSRFIDGGGAADEFEAHLAELNRELESRVAQSAATQLQVLADEYRDTGPAVSELAEAERRLQAESTELTSQFNSLRSAIDAVSAQVGEYHQAIEAAGESSERAGKSLDKAAGSTVNEKLTGLCSNASQLISAFQQIAEVCRAAYTVIAKFAETSPQFAELKDSLDGMCASANTAVERFAATDFGSGVIAAAAGHLDRMSQGLEALPTLWQDVKTLAHSAAAEIEESLGVEVSMHRGVLNAIRDENAALDAKLALVKQERAQAAVNKTAETALASIKKAERQAEQQAAISRITDGMQAAKLVNEELKSIEARRKAGTLTAEEATASVNKIAALRARQRKIQADEETQLRAQRDKDQADADAREAAKVTQARRAADARTAAEKKAFADQNDAWSRALKEQHAALVKAFKERQQFAEKEEKAKDQIKAQNVERQKNNAAGLLASQSPRAVATQLGADRSLKAKRAFVAKHAAEYQKSKRSSRELDYQIRAATDPAARKALMKSKSVHDKKMANLEAGFQKEGRVARQQGFRDAVSGRAGTDEIAEAQQNLANNVINHGQGSSRLSQASAEALREATRVLLEQQAEQRAIAQDLDQTKQALQRMQGQSLSKSRRQAGR